MEEDIYRLEGKRNTGLPKDEKKFFSKNNDNPQHLLRMYPTGAVLNVVYISFNSHKTQKDRMFLFLFYK